MRGWSVPIGVALLSSLALGSAFALPWPIALLGGCVATVVISALIAVTMLAVDRRARESLAGEIRMRRELGADGGNAGDAIPAADLYGWWLRSDNATRTERLTDLEHEGETPTRPPSTSRWTKPATVKSAQVEGGPVPVQALASTIALIAGVPTAEVSLLVASGLDDGLSVWFGTPRGEFAVLHRRTDDVFIAPWDPEFPTRPDY